MGKPPDEPPNTPGVPGAWVKAARAGEIPVDTAIEIVAGGVNVAVFNQAGNYRAIGNTCPHLKGGALAAGTLIGDVVSCPFHGWMFKLDSGECINRPGAAARTYRTRVNGTDIEIFLPVPG